jgi:hypothetical protein
MTEIRNFGLGSRNRFHSSPVSISTSLGAVVRFSGNAKVAASVLRVIFAAPPLTPVGDVRSFVRGMIARARRASTGHHQNTNGETHLDIQFSASGCQHVQRKF